MISVREKVHEQAQFSKKKQGRKYYCSLEHDFADG